MAPTANFYKVAKYLQALVTANKVALGLQDIWYGDMDLIPHTPSLCVETGPTSRQLVGAPARVDNNFTVYLMIYHGKIQDVQLNRSDCDQMAVAVQNLLHTDLRLDNPTYDGSVATGNGLVVFGMVTGIEPGYTVRSKSLMRTSRVTWEGTSKTNLP